MGVSYDLETCLVGIVDRQGNVIFDRNIGWSLRRIRSIRDSKIVSGISRSMLKHESPNACPENRMAGIH